MTLYAIILLLTAVVFGIVAVQIYKGKTQLIHEYHQTNVADKSAYGKAFGKAMGVIPGAMILSAGISLFCDSAEIVYSAVAVLIIGLAVGIACIFYVQKKYNGGLFSA